MKILAVILLSVSMASCGVFYKKNDDNFWKQATPTIGKYVND